MIDYSHLSPAERAEVAKFAAFLTRRSERPDEPEFQAYAEIYGEVLFDESKGGWLR